MQVAMSLRRSIRSVDTAARIGGDEFCVLLPQQDLKSAAKLAARLATAVEEEVATPGDPPVTMSIGVAASPEHGDDAESLVDTADRAMYRAKAAGEGIALGDPPGTQGMAAEEATT
jgi:diguanylate cyclase (GGDEF)-like protein